MIERAAWGLVIVLATGCGDATAIEHQEQEVQAGTSAKAYRYAALVDDGGGCSGALIAPRVVMTAAHCVDQATPDASVRVRLPALGEERRVSAWARFRDEHGQVHTGEDVAGFVDLEQHDVALAILASPIELDGYPDRATTITPAGTLVFGIGRTRGTAAEPLLRSPDDDLEHHGSLAYRVRRGLWGDYLEPGDSGGPWVRSDTGQIVGVHRGGTEHDLIYPVYQTACWIAHVVLAHGGEGPSEATGAVPSVDDACL